MISLNRFRTGINAGKTKKKKNIKYIIKEKIRFWSKMIINWRFVICFFIGWMITNGWSYILLGLGLLFDNSVMTAIASAYLAFLWLPFTPEKIVSLTIALMLVKWLFPRQSEKVREQLRILKSKEF